MIDLESASRRLLADQSDDPTPPMVLHRRAQHRRRKRRAVLSGAGAVAVVAAAIGLVFAAGDGGRVSVVAPVVPDGPGLRAELRSPEALAVTPNGELLIDNLGTDQILSRSPGGALTVVAGDGRAGYSGDGGPATQARLDHPGGVTVGADGAVYVADTGNNRIRAISPQGTITTVAGDGAVTGPTTGAARRVAVAEPESVAVGQDGRIYITDNAGVQVLAHGTLRTLLRAGPGKLRVHGRPTAWFPSQITVSSTSDLYVSDTSPKLLVEFSAAGRILHVWSRYVSQLAPGKDGAILVADYGHFGLDRINSGALRSIITFHLGRFPARRGVFRPAGVVVTADGTVYADTDGVNGGTTAPALLEIPPRQPARLLEPGVATPRTT